MTKSLWQELWDFIGIPARFVLFDQQWLHRFRWTTLEDERISFVLPVVRSRLLDIGAGTNALVRRYGDGVGVDVYDWGGEALVVKNAARLPFSDQSFDTVTFVASLNHIPNRVEALFEAHRLLKPTGQLLITMINPIFGGIGHAIWWYSEDKIRGGMKDGEAGGLWTSNIVALCTQAGFQMREHRRFLYGLNNFYRFGPVR